MACKKIAAIFYVVLIISACGSQTRSDAGNDSSRMTDSSIMNNPDTIRNKTSDTAAIPDTIRNK